jgi:hypothetical protein
MARFPVWHGRGILSGTLRAMRGTRRSAAWVPRRKSREWRSKGFTHEAVENWSGSE